MIKVAVKEVFKEEKSEFILKNLSSVSKEEMEDIEKIYGKPPVKKEVAHIEILEIENYFMN